jgi:protein-disulfide isomerase/uncharacterized membrane protein
VFKKSIPVVLMLLSLAGLCLGMLLTAEHFDLNHSNTGHSTSVLGFDGLQCGEGGGCQKVNTSSYAKISLGENREPMPVSVPAVGFFFMLAFLTGAAIRATPRRRRYYLSLAALFCVPALAFALYLFAVQALVIGSFCVYCLGLDALTITVAALIYVGHGGGLAGIIEDVKNSPRFTAAICILAMLYMDYRIYEMYTTWIEDGASTAAFGSAARGSDSHGSHGAHDAADETDPKVLEEARQAVAEFVAGYPELSTVEIEVNPFDGTRGNLDGGILVTEFADFECPHCKLAGFYVKDIAHRYGDRVGFVFKNYPLGTACNDNIKRDVHEDACEAAVGVQCAKRQGAFWPFHDGTFDNQGDLGRATLLRVAAQLGLDGNVFAECLEKDTVWDEVRTQVAQGHEAGLTGTPTFFINGKLLPNSHPLFVEAAIRYELREHGETSLPEDVDAMFPR